MPERPLGKEFEVAFRLPAFDVILTDLLASACMAAVDPKQAAAANRERCRNMLAASPHPMNQQRPATQRSRQARLSDWVDKLLEKVQRTVRNRLAMSSGERKSATSGH
jgi:hypothetical protein